MVVGYINKKKRLKRLSLQEHHVCSRVWSPALPWIAECDLLWLQSKNATSTFFHSPMFAIHSDLIFRVHLLTDTMLLCILEDVLTWNLSPGGRGVWQYSDPRTFPLGPCATSLRSGITRLIFSLHYEADNADNTQHTTLPALLFLSPPLSSIFNRMSHYCLKFNLDKAAALCFKASPSCTFLCGIILIHLWMFGCYIMQHIQCENRLFI